eukprot:RCo040732
MSRTVPIWVSFVLVGLVFTGAFTCSLWVTLNQAAVSSVDDISMVFRTSVMRELNHRLQSVLDEMLLLLNTWRAVPGLQSSSVEEVFSFAQSVMSSNPNVVALSYGRPNGEAIGATLLPTGCVGVGHRLPSPETALVNTTFRCYNESQGTANFTTAFEARSRPWYTAALGAQGPVFTYSPRAAVTPLSMISLSSAVFDPNETLAVVLGLAYPFSLLTDQLTNAHRELRSSGMLVLMEQSSGLTIAAATASPATLDADIAEVQSLTQGDIQNYDVKHEFFHTFGDAVVLQVFVSTAQASGLQWRLAVILPDSDYYSHIWKQNKIAGAVAGSVFALFLVVLVIVSQVLIARPLRLLTSHLLQLRQTLSRSGINSADDLLDLSGAVEPGLPPPASERQVMGCSSNFTEIHALYDSVVAALSAATDVSLQRAQEAAQAAERRQAELQLQSLMKAKESFFAVMSHEMRTPLTACIGMAEVLR